MDLSSNEINGGQNNGEQNQAQISCEDCLFAHGPAPVSYKLTKTGPHILRKLKRCAHGQIKRVTALTVVVHTAQPQLP
jgi:hypothetical protein